MQNSSLLLSLKEHTAPGSEQNFCWVVRIQVFWGCTARLGYAFLYHFYLRCPEIEYMPVDERQQRLLPLFLHYVMVLMDNGILRWYLYLECLRLTVSFFFYIFCDVSLVISEFILLAVSWKSTFVIRPASLLKVLTTLSKCVCWRLEEERYRLWDLGHTSGTQGKGLV
jgi:hypothetical protein